MKEVEWLLKNSWDEKLPITCYVFFGSFVSELKKKGILLNKCHAKIVCKIWKV